ncbi:MAG: FGGY family carbohydrate kinase [Thermoanaerobaculia bacterium]
MNAAATAIAVIDQGSTITKGAVYGLDGRELFTTETAVERRITSTGVEHDPHQLIAAVQQVLTAARSAAPIAAVALTCQRSTCLVWDRETGEPLTTAISWQDRSQLPRVKLLAKHADEVSRRTGLRLSPHYAAPKLAHLLESVSGGRRRAAAGEIVAGTLDAFLVHQLTGSPCTEPGQAGRTLLYNLENGGWDSFLADLFGIPLNALPEVRPSVGDGRRIGDIPLIAVAGDQQAALLGHGGWSPGVTMAHFGTGAFVLASCGEEIVRHPNLLSAVIAEVGTTRRFQLEGTVNSAGSAADWACRLTGESLAAWATREIVPEGLPWVLPAFNGVAAPWWRPEARGVIAGLTIGTQGEDILGGVLLGVAMRILDCIDALGEAGIAPEVLRVSGKLTRLNGLVGILADVGQIPVEVSALEETGLSGLAKLAIAGLTGTHDLLGEALTGARREPSWTADRALALRGRWRRFVRRSLDG